MSSSSEDETSSASWSEESDSDYSDDSSSGDSDSDSDDSADDTSADTYTRWTRRQEEKIRLREKFEAKYPLFPAIKQGDLATAKKLISAMNGNKKELNRVDPAGTTALTVACWEVGMTGGHVKNKKIRKNMTAILKLLLKEGVDIRTKDNYGHSPLMAAASAMSEEKVKILIKAGARVNTQNDNGVTPLHIVCMPPPDNAKASLPLAKLLIKNGADVNAQNEHGVTPLRGAIYHNKIPNPKLVELLLKNGADPSIETVDHDTIWTIAGRNTDFDEANPGNDLFNDWTPAKKKPLSITNGAKIGKLLEKYSKNAKSSKSSKSDKRSKRSKKK